MNEPEVQLEKEYWKTLRRIGELEALMRENGLSWAEQSKWRHLQEQAGRIERARDRKNQGNYGRCQHCDQPIDPERLALIPYAEVCVPCHQQNVKTTLRQRQPALALS
jgi:RNA polymerase-binding transcription factor DksA